MAQFDFKQAIAKVEANKPKPATAGYSDAMDAVEGQMKAAVAAGQAKNAAKNAADTAKFTDFEAQKAANVAQKLGGYEKQLAAAEAGEADFAAREGAISKEATAAARNLNRQGAAAASRGRNLGTIRGMAEQTGITRAQMGTQYEQQQLANAAQRRMAQQQAGALQTQLAEERQRALVQGTTGKQDALNQAYANIDAIAKAKDEAQAMYLSDEDVLAAANEMRTKVLPGATTAEERAAIEAYIQQYIKDNT